jgi:hypothetical protein
MLECGSDRVVIVTMIETQWSLKMVHYITEKEAVATVSYPNLSFTLTYEGEVYGYHRGVIEHDIVLAKVVAYDDARWNEVPVDQKMLETLSEEFRFDPKTLLDKEDIFDKLDQQKEEGLRDEYIDNCISRYRGK